MALTYTPTGLLNSKLPEFNLASVDGQRFSNANFTGAKALVVMFICNHCPFVKHVWDELIRLGADYTAKGVSVIAISSNDIVQYPADAPEEMKKLAVFSYPDVIKTIQNPTEEMKLAAVKKNPYVIQFIKNPSEEVQLAAISKAPVVIELYDNPSENAMLLSLKLSGGTTIKYIKNRLKVN